MVTGIICEYNPFHLGHKKQLDALRARDPEGATVCLMSGNYVQRGAPAILDRCLRAKTALQNGADLVLELPVTVSVSSAEGFAAGGVSILSGFCDNLCFGAEEPELSKLEALAKALLSQEFTEALRSQLQAGCSFPAARQAALENLGLDGRILQSPNNILAVEYCKAILSQNSKLQPMPIYRGGSYHGTDPDRDNPSATFVRSQMIANKDWQSYVPENSIATTDGATIHTLENGQRAILYRLRTMTEAEYAALPYGSEGLWRKLMHNALACSTLDEILENTKSKRYTRSRLDRMVLCAFLGITQNMLEQKAPYVRVLALNDRGREVLKKARKSGCFLNLGETADHPYQQLEDRWSDLYGLFAQDCPDAPGANRKQRIIKE